MMSPYAPFLGAGGASILSPGAFAAGGPIGPGSLFNIAGAPIAVLGGVFSAGLPLGGPVSQVFRGSGPEPNTLFVSTITPAGPIGTFLIGRGGVDLQFGPTALYLNFPEAIGQPSFLVGTPLERASQLTSF